MHVVDVLRSTQNRKIRGSVGGYTRGVYDIMNGNGNSQLQARKGLKHALILPFCLHAHLVGIYRHALELAKRGVTITFVSLESDVAVLKTFAELRDLPVDFNLVSYSPSYKSLDTEAEFEAIKAFVAGAATAFQPVREELLAKQKAGVPGPTCIIADRVLQWSADLAKELNIPFYNFFSCGASLARLLQATPDLAAHGKLVKDEETDLLREFEGCLNVPGLPPLLYRDLPLHNKEAYLGSLMMGKAVADADALIINTFYELEAPQIEALRQSAKQNLGGKKIQKLFLIGPISKHPTFKDSSLVPKAAAGVNVGQDCLRWLDNRQPKSVLYINFGSLSRFSASQVRELALALEASEQSFLWVVLPHKGIPSLEQVLPPDYIARLGGRGLIVTSWVPQAQLLAHASVGGFLTHCGWNSIIESVVAGVPVIGWPQGAEQAMNLRILVDQKIAVEVPVEYHGDKPVGCDELERSVRLLMLEGGAMRSRIHELQMKAKEAVADGGPSVKAVDDIADLIPSRTWQ
ncbi:hypothetical protein Mapa_010435 [Marchantia paleacea]|nr:hypothetical protein Mapa_010435 [Marchantia paleacea]